MAISAKNFAPFGELPDKGDVIICKYKNGRRVVGAVTLVWLAMDEVAFTILPVGETETFNFLPGLESGDLKAAGQRQSWDFVYRPTEESP
jgi:hypothetical protein